jgi:uncharacterized protein (DUF983 family)
VLGSLREECPNCGRSHVFEQNTKFFQMPLMKTKCEECNYQFEREPGYFLGAMYISYGIAVFFGILTFLLMNFFFPTLPLICTPLAIILVIISIARKNFKVSRIIYMHIFPW